jgi:aminomethyltransferase
MTRRTPLFEAHLDSGARMVDFYGWEMPLNYGSQIEEHRAVRETAGMFDVSHMTIVDVAGEDAEPYLRKLLANDVAKLDPRGALYGVLLLESGGILDDLIVYRREEGYRCIVNAGTREGVIRWMNDHATNVSVTVTERDDLAMIAVQGPQAIQRLVECGDFTDVQRLARFSMLERGQEMIGRTGYTGEDGVEVMLGGDAARQLWGLLRSAGVRPAGLAARDTLRLEAGLNLYGQDMTQDNHPLESNLGWTIAWQPTQRDFIGRSALEALREQGVAHKLTGVVLTEKGVIRQGHRVVCEAGEGVVTSGIFSPTLGYSIGLARVPRKARGACHVEVRGKNKAGRFVKPPFVRDGKPAFD